MRLTVSSACLVLLAAPVFGQVATRKEPVYYSGADRSPAARPQPPAARFRLRPAREVRLEPLNATERAALGRSGRKVIAGVHRPLDAALLGTGAWDATPAGAPVWRMAVRSPGATGLRVEFGNFDVGAGQVWLHDGDQVVGPYTGRGTFDNGQFWSASIFSESATVEYEPDGDHPAGSAPPFELRAVSHQTEPGTPPLEVLGSVPEAGPKDAADVCHLNPNCYSEWKDGMRMVAQLSFEKDGVRELCSGVLVSTRDNSLKPYLLTAAHCISDEASARSLEVYWTYQKSTCNQAAFPERKDSTRSTAGANLIGHSAIDDGDYSLLLLKDIPSGVWFAGWDMSDPAVGSDLTGIHHPSGSYKRISFADRVADAPANVDGSILPADKFLTVHWDKGRVEPGSSGSPLFSSPGVVVGTLTWGQVSNYGVCVIEPSFAGYGRFSYAYNHLKDYFENLPAALVRPDNANLTFAALNGVASPARRTVRLQTTTAGDVLYKLRADAPWIRLSNITGKASASAPSSVDISIDPSKFDRADRFVSTVTILSGSAEPQFINVIADVAVDRSNVVATVSPNPVLAQNASPRWSFKIRLEEKAGIATRVTSVTLNGLDYSSSLTDWFGDTRLAGKGSLEAQLSSDYSFAPGPQYLEFRGTDEISGRPWYVPVTVTLVQ
jgi:hypothetical protein